MNIYDKTKQYFTDSFASAPDVISMAPGRLEILGNHTDYNEGVVLSAATNLATYFAAKKNNSNTCKLHSFNSDWKAEFSLQSLDKPATGCWSDYIKGVVYELHKIAPEKINGFDGGIYTTIPLSAGMSSSAALEVSSSIALGKLFGITLTKEEWAKLGQRVENNYMGLNSGLLDQFSSIFGQKNKMIFSDFRKVKVIDTIQIPEGYSIVVANTMVKHNLVDSAYNDRRESCEDALKSIQAINPNKKALRDVSSEELEAVKDNINFDSYKKAKHIVEECERVNNGIKLLKKNNIEGFGELLYQSHESSKQNFANSCKELDYFIELSKTIPGCVGARLSGGGFGGISIHLVKEDMATQYSERLLTAFKSLTNINNATAIICNIGDGASIL